MAEAERPAVATSPGAPGTWWLNMKRKKPRMVRVAVPGEVTSWTGDERPSSTQTRVGH